jgi:preprotein translocase subunit Sec61beta
MERHAIARQNGADAAGAPPDGRGGWRAAAVLLTLATLMGGAAAFAAGDAYPLKAAYLLNFARLIEWPDAARPAEGEPLVLGVTGDAAIAQTIASELANTRVRGHSVVVRSVSTAAEMADCHIVFVASDGDADAALDATSSSAALTVGESEGFAERGGVINFFSEGEQIHFEINPQAADRAGLKISSRLLRLARLVSSS